MGRFEQRYGAVDRFQQRHAWLGLPLAVLQKYSDDQGAYLAATITYYGFFAIFPLLLVLTTALGFLLPGHHDLERSVVDSALSQFPVIGPELRGGLLRGSALALSIGVVVALWSGMGVFLAAQNAMNQLWGVPFKRRPDPVRGRVRALVLLLLLGGATIATTILAGLSTVDDKLGPLRAIGILSLSTSLNVGIFWIGFRVLTAREVSLRQLRSGAIAAGVLYTALQSIGAFYVGHVLHRATNTYGTFALVIGLLSWIYLATVITLLAAEANVVTARGLWPRSFSAVIEQPPTSADMRALTQRGRVEERRQDETVDIGFSDPNNEERPSH
jgi:membrane protein